MHPATQMVPCIIAQAQAKATLCDRTPAMGTKQPTSASKRTHPPSGGASRTACRSSFLRSNSGCSFTAAPLINRMSHATYQSSTSCTSIRCIAVRIRQISFQLCKNKEAGQSPRLPDLCLGRIPLRICSVDVPICALNKESQHCCRTGTQLLCQW